MPGPFRVPRRHGQVPNTQAYVPATVNVGNTVSTTGSTTITGSVVANPTTSASFVTNQITVTSTTVSTLIFAQSASVIFREVTNPTSSNAAVFIGSTSSMTITTGHYLPGGVAFDQQNNSAALYAVAATGSVTVSTIGW